MNDGMTTPGGPEPRREGETGPLKLMLASLLLGGLAVALLWWVMVPRQPPVVRQAEPAAPAGSTSGSSADVATAAPAAAVPPEIPTLPDPQLRSKLLEYRDRVTESPTDVARWGELAMALHANALYGQAAECYDEAARLEPTQGDWLYLGGLSRLIEDPDGAIERVRTATSVYGDAPFARMMLIELLLNRGRVDEAAQLLDQNGLAGIEEARVLASKGQLALVRGRTEEARDAGERAAALKPGVRQIHGMLAAAYRQLGRADDARVQQELASKAILTWSDPVQDRMRGSDQGIVVLLQEARDLLNAERVPEATAMLEKAVIDYPDNPQAWQRLGECYRIIRQDAKAEVAFTRAVEISPNFIEAMLPLGMIKVLSGRPAEARAIAERVVQMEPQRFLGHLLLAMSLQAQEQWDQAIAAYRAAAAVSPGSAWPLVGIANCLNASGDPDAALEYARQAVRLDPKDSSAAEMLRRLTTAADPGPERPDVPSGGF